MVSLPSTESGQMDRMDRLSDDDDDEPSSGSDAYEEGDLLSAAMDDDVTAQLAAAGWKIKDIHGDFHIVFFFQPIPILVLVHIEKSQICSLEMTILLRIFRDFLFSG